MNNQAIKEDETKPSRKYVSKLKKILNGEII